MSELKFNRTLSKREFAKETNATKIELTRNPKTEKLWFKTDIAGISGKVSNNFNPEESYSISECTDETSGEKFFMLHNESKVNVEATLELA